jgi:hypothetical protein
LNLNLDNTSAGTDMKKKFQGCWHVLAPLFVLSRQLIADAANLAVLEEIFDDIAGTWCG